MKATFWLIILLIAYLAIAGFPASVTRALEQQLMQASGVEVRVQRLYWHPVDGLIASSVQLFGQAADRHPMVTVGEAVIQFDPRQWLRRQPGVRTVRIHDAHIAVNPHGPLVDLDAGEVIHMQVTRAVVGVSATQFRLQEGAGRFLDFDLSVQGTVRRSDRPVRLPAVDAEPLWSRWRDAHPPWLDTLLHDLGELQIAGASSVEVDFWLDFERPAEHRVNTFVAAENLRFRGLLFDDLLLHLAYADHVVRLPYIQVSAPDGQFTARGQFDHANDEMEVYLFSDLPPVYWRNLMPDEIRQPMERARIHAFGSTLIEATIGPSPLREFGQAIRARVEATEVDAHGVWMETVAAHLIRDRDLVHVFDLEALLGRGAGQGKAVGRVTYDLGQDIYFGDVAAALDPHIVLPIAGYSRIAAEIIQAIQLGSTVPSLDVQFSGNVRDEPTFNFEGTVQGANFVYAGSRVLSFDSTFLVTNRVMRIDPLTVHRVEGSVTGWYQHNFNDQIVDLDVHGGVDPRALGRLAGGTIEEILRAFRFEGPVDVQISGRIDYQNHVQTDYRAQGRARQIGWRLLLADECTLDWVAQGDRISMTNLVVHLYGGTMTGQVDLSQIGGDSPVAYAAHGDVQQVEFASLLRDLRQAESDMQRGALSGWFDVTGLAEDDWRASVHGRGRVRIDDGQIFQIRLFGGLSDLLHRIYPRLGYLVQSDVRADFEIEDRQVSSADIRFIGNIISLRGWGSYSLDDELDFIVQVQPLRRGLLVDAVRLVTYPVSRLLQFSLDGTLSDPDWRMDPLPRGRSNRR